MNNTNQEKERALKEEAIRLYREGFANPLREVACACTAPIFWYTYTSGKRGTLLNSGTAIFVDAGHGSFVISARHVLEQFRADSVAYEKIVCQLDSIRFDPIGRLIAEDDHTDIVTFSISPIEVSTIGKISHNVPGLWPPDPPEEGQGIFLGGYRGQDKIVGQQEITWGFSFALVIAGRVDPDHIAIQFEREHWVCEDMGDAPEPHATWGGVSGGPVFTLVPGKIYSWRLSNVITEFSSNLEIMRASTLAKVGPDGSIIR